MSKAGFEALITIDQNLRHQQNLQTVGIAVVVLVAATNHLKDLTPLVPDVRTVLKSLQPGDFVEVTA